MNHEIILTTYANDSCLRTLGIYDSVHWMLNKLVLSHFYAQRDPTYVILTLDFLGSIVYTTHIMTASIVGTVSFRMFNKKYQFSLNQIADLLRFPYGGGVICETPEDTDWAQEFGHL